MALTDFQKVRNLIGDNYKTDVLTITSDGSSLVYELPRGAVKQNSVSISPNTLTIDNVDYESSLVTLNSAANNGDIFNISYQYSAFSDAEVNSYLSDNGNDIRLAAIDLVTILMADTAKRYDYSTGIESFSPSQIFQNLKELKNSLQETSSDTSSLTGKSTAKKVPRTTKYGNLKNLYE